MDNQMMVRITGASGYLGGRIAEALHADGHDLHLHARAPSQAGRDDLTRFTRRELILGDLRDEPVIEQLHAGAPEALIHCVALDHHASAADPLKSLTANVGTLMRLLHRPPPSLKLVVYLSTVQVYGQNMTGAIDEESPAAPHNYYGLTHLQAEEAVAFAARVAGLRSVVLRLSNIFGAPRLAESKGWELVLNDFCRQAADAGVIRLLSDGTPWRDFFPLNSFQDLVRQVVRDHASLPPHTRLLVGSGRTVRLLDAAIEVAEMAAPLRGSEVTLDVAGRSMRPPFNRLGGQPPWHLQTRRLAAYAPHLFPLPVKSEIERTLQWRLNHG